LITPTAERQSQRLDRGCDARRPYAEVDGGDPINSSGNDEAAKNVSAAILYLQQQQQ